ncbi:TonB-dependent receptor [Parabacteroides sp. PF5-9]|uniref:TonB-dependent receptor n=1 Tax=Parabacteroides sp. PF5-9 TaxID=1742404 RepID=UPI002473FCB5|nr:TonB-dependent receptor [Parabacteroides sp. PF5-9]MDH6358149.1 iron complex outermembrane receptor protein [Parabacteroides sp. PF5-9]
MNMRYLCLSLCLSLTSILSVKADHINTSKNDTIRTFNIDEVVVTSSTKETNDLRVLPGSVTILTPQMISGRQIDALKDISSFVPNLYMPDYGAKLTSAIYIRGIGARSSGQSIGLYVDNVPYLDKSTLDFELTDIQRIEVLRGPQGTLYGRNAMGGIINIYTLSPFNYQGTKLSVSGGNYGQFKAKASHYNKVSETVGLSLSGYYDRNDGFFTNAYTGRKADRLESVGGRFKFDWRIKPNFTLAYTFSADYTDQGAFPYGKYDKENDLVNPVMLNDSSNYNRKMMLNQLFMEYRTDQFILSSTTGYQYLKDNMKMDQDYDTLSIFTLNQKQKQNAFSQEFTIKSNTPSNYQWSFGLYGFHNDLHTEGPVTFKEDGVRIILQEKVFDQIGAGSAMPIKLKVTDETLYIPGTFETPSYGAALFHQSTYNNLFIKGLSVTAGVRLDYEKQRLEYDATAKMNLVAALPNGMVLMDLSEYYGPSIIDLKTSQDYWQLLPKVSLKYQCTPRTFTYFSIAKGYKAGGYNVQMSADVMQAQMQYDMMTSLKDFMPESVKPVAPQPIEDVAAYKPEKSWNYELGVKSELIPDRLHSELTIFYMDIRDLQLTQFVNSGEGRMLTNAGKAKSFGIEATLRASILPGLTSDINYGYTRSTFRDYNNGLEDFKGNYIPYIPRHTLSVGLNYTKLLSSCWLDQFTVSAQFSGNGNIYWTEQNDISQNFYGILNAKAGVRKGIVNFNVWSRNITDTKYSAFYFESLGNTFMQLGKPFQIGAEVSVAF